MAYFQYPFAIAGSVSSAAFPLLAPNGSAAAPSYSFGGGTGGAGTGVFAGGTNILSFSTAGVLAMTVAANQQVTIGSAATTNQQHTIQVSDTGGSFSTHLFLTAGAAASTPFYISNNRTDCIIGLSGGSSSNDGANIRLFGSTTPSNNNKFEIRQGTTAKFSLDSNAVGIFANAIATNRLDVASAATITALSCANSFVKLTGATATALQGITAGVDGQRLTLVNLTGSNLTVQHENAGASASARITTMTGADVATTANGAAEFIYDTGSSRWICLDVTA